MDEDDPRQVCYTIYTHPREWEGVGRVLDDLVRLVPCVDVPRNGEPPAPMTHVLVLPEHVEELRVKAEWYVGLAHSEQHRKLWKLTETQWQAMIDFCRLFLKAYRHLGGKED